MTPPSLWQSVKNIREAFPNGNGFYVPGGETPDMVTVLGERFKLAPNAAQPYYSYEMNQGDLRDLMAAVTEGKLRSDFMTFAIHAHQFADTKGGERGGGLPPTAEHCVRMAQASALSWPVWQAQCGIPGVIWRNNLERGERRPAVPGYEFPVLYCPGD